MKNDLEINGYRLELTCGSCPEQYDVFDGERQVGYLRLRHGEFTAEYPDCGGEMVYKSEPDGDGQFEGHERMEHLGKAVAALQSADRAAKRTADA